jgi:hypothetical protein
MQLWINEVKFLEKTAKFTQKIFLLNELVEANLKCRRASFEDDQ